MKEPIEGGKWRICLCSLLVFYVGLALAQLAESGHDASEMSLCAPPQASHWHTGCRSLNRHLGKIKEAEIKRKDRHML